MSNRFSLDTGWLIIGLGVLIRLAFLGFVNLLPEEAYYWNYAQHLDIGYLDHPPMVAWLIHISESVLGRSEFAVRLPAFLGWFLLAFFMHRFAENTVGKGAGKTLLLLLVSLPIYMSVGFLMTPDAPFYVCWAGSLFFLERAIIGTQRSAWFGAGICLGLGLLSKYTMALIVPATVVYLLTDKESRRWFRKPQPYFALLIGLLLFLPVLYWNAQHDWASFAFQGSRRWSGGTDFHLHILIGSILILITPLGLYDAVRALRSFWTSRMMAREANELQFRKHLFLAVFTLVPLTVFVIHSLLGQPKLNWTGPVWLAVLPLVAAGISRTGVLKSLSTGPLVPRRWVVTSTALIILYAGGFGYLVVGMPGIPTDNGMRFPIAWKAFGDRIEELETRLENDINSEPIIIGLDNYWLASQASFYDPDADSDMDTLPEVAGENFVGGGSLMWDQWVSPKTAAGRDGLLVSFTEDRLNEPWVTRRFAQLGEINEEVLTNHEGEIGRFYWRTGYNYGPE